MKLSFLLLFLLFSFKGFSQVSGAITIDGRKVVEDISYELFMHTDGILVFDISVDVEGNVTSCIWNKVESTINSTRYSFTSKNRIITALKFEKGSKFPTFHQGKVTIHSIEKTE